MYLCRNNRSLTQIHIYLQNNFMNCRGFKNNFFLLLLDLNSFNSLFHEDTRLFYFPFFLNDRSRLQSEIDWLLKSKSLSNKPRPEACIFQASRTDSIWLKIETQYDLNLERKSLGFDREIDLPSVNRFFTDFLTYIPKFSIREQRPLNVILNFQCWGT